MQEPSSATLEQESIGANCVTESDRCAQILHDNGASLGAKRVDRRRAVLRALVAAQVISPRDVESLDALESAMREPLDRALFALGLLVEDTLVDAFSELTRWPLLSTLKDIDLSPAGDVSTAFLLKHRTVPSRTEGGVLVAVIADPSDLTGLRGCAFALGEEPLPVLASTRELEALLLRLAPAENFDAEAPSAVVLEDAESLRDLASGEPAVRLCARLVGEASNARASDIHIEAEERDYRVRIRVDGELVERDRLTVKQGLAAISRFKILAGLDIAERRRPQDGRLGFAVAGRPLDLRFSSTPSVYGEDVVIRLLQRDHVRLDLVALGFTPKDAAKLHALTDRPNGIVLLTGPTGCGKTTTLYALLQRLATAKRKILTIEDPVEYKIAGISQTQINPAIGLDFAKGLRSFLRHDPDIIMVGEMRDLETARTAVQAAMTGHLVLSTLHTNDAPSAVTRLLDMGVDDYLVASTLSGVVAQRLVRKICAACGGRPRAVDARVCTECEGSGFRGRLAIAEVLEIDDRLRPFVKRGVDAASFAKEAAAQGFRTMAEDGAAKIAQGLTTRAELEKAILL